MSFNCRPLICSALVFLKSSHKRQLLCAVGFHADNGTYLIANYAKNESSTTWGWFLDYFKKTDFNLNESNEYTFMSNKQKELLHVIATLFPDAKHRCRVRHMYENFKNVDKNGTFVGVVLKKKRKERCGIV